MGANAGTHLRHTTDCARSRADARAARLCNEMGALLDSMGEYAAARPYYERALAIRAQVLGPGHPDTRSARASLVAIEQRLAADQ